MDEIFNKIFKPEIIMLKADTHNVSHFTIQRIIQNKVKMDINEIE